MLLLESIGVGNLLTTPIVALLAMSRESLKSCERPPTPLAGMLTQTQAILDNQAM